MFHTFLPSYLVSWFPHRHDENVLWLHFEDMKADLTQCVSLVSKFLGIGEDDPELLKKVEYQVELAYLSLFADDTSDYRHPSISCHSTEPNSTCILSNLPGMKLWVYPATTGQKGKTEEFEREQPVMVFNRFPKR